LCLVDTFRIGEQVFDVVDQILVYGLFHGMQGLQLKIN
jgi:hypothetical protein